jgi:hypothetical protein
MLKSTCLLFVLLFSTSCLKVGTDEVSIFRSSELDLTRAIGFEDLKRNILAPKQCLRCHSEYATEAGLAEVVKAGIPEESELYLQIRDGLMPKEAPPLSPNNLEYVRLYILQLKEKPVELPVDGPKGEISFEELSQRIIRPYCLECHKRWTEYDRVKKHIVPGNSEESNFYVEIEIESMPPKDEGKLPLSLEDKEFVKRYIDTLK